MAKRNQHAKQGFGVDDPQDAIHMGESKRIRLEDVPLDNTDGDNHVGNRAYNDARYKLKASGPNTAKTFLEGGYWIYSGVGLIYNVVRTVYMLPGYDTPFTVEPTQLTLVSDPDDPRFARPQWNDLGVCSALYGIAEADPIIPEVLNPLTEIAGSPVLLGAGATVPDPGETPIRVVYDEQALDEAVGSYSGAGTADFANGSFHSGSIAINVSNQQNGSALLFTFPADVPFSEVETGGFFLNLKASMNNSGHNLAIRFLDAADSPLSAYYNLLIQKSVINEYQLVAFDVDIIGISPLITNFRKIELTWRRTGSSATHAGFYLDLFIIQGGIVPPVVAGDVELVGHITGSGETGEPIETTIHESAISDQTEQTDPLPGTAEHVVRLADGSLRKVADSLIAAGKVDKVTGKSLIDDTEIARLAGINDRFKGKYTSLAALEIALPTANAGDYAQVDTGGSDPVVNYNWDVEDGWVIGSTGGAVISNTDELTEGSSNLYFTTARVLATIITGVSFVTNRAILATDSILEALGFLQKQITDAIASISGKQDTLVSGTNIKTVNGNSLLGSGDLNILHSDFTASSLPVAFDIPRKYGFTTAITANITFGITGAFESSMAKILHNHTTEPTITGTGGVTVVKDGGEYVPSVDNIIYLICHKNDAGTVTKVSYTITQDNP